MRGWLTFGRVASGVTLTTMVVTFVVNALNDEPGAFKAMINIAEALGTLVVPWLLWRLYSWCTQRLRELDGVQATAPSASPISRSESRVAGPWPVAAKVMAPGIIIAVVLAFLFRYETTPADRGVAYKRDRWTGDTYFIAGTTERKVQQVDDRPE